jgi:hypothetical protein
LKAPRSIQAWISGNNLLTLTPSGGPEPTWLRTPAVDHPMKTTAIITLILSCALLSLSASAGQKELLEKKVQELIELNKIVVEKNVDLKKYNNQTVFIKAKLLKTSDTEYKVKVEEVSSEAIKDDGKKDDESVIVKAKISEKTDKTFHLDIEHVLPPEKTESDNKEKEPTK